MGMFDISSKSNGVPYVWSLPHFYLVSSNDTTQHPRQNLFGLVPPTGPRYQSLVPGARWGHEAEKVLPWMLRGVVGRNEVEVGQRPDIRYAVAFGGYVEHPH